MATVVSLPDDVSFEVSVGETLLEAALKSNVPMAHACGGRAKCSTCRVWVLDGLDSCPTRSETEAALADRLRLTSEVRLACQLRPAGDLRLRRLVLDETDLAINSQLDRSVATQSGRACDIVVFFSDIAGFTGISERLSPYDLMYLLNRYFTQAGQIIEANGGYVDKFLGDGLMAIFGIEDQPEAPIRAVNAALQTLAAVDRMKPFLSSMLDLDFDIRIGLHWGEAVIGSLGSLGHERLTAIGEVVNVASRVEAANKEAGTRLLISDALHSQIEESVEVSDYVRVRLPGTSERMTLHEVRGLTPEAHAALNVEEPRESMRFAGKRWVRALRDDELVDGGRRILEFADFYVVVVRRGDTFMAFNNACPHLHLPFFEYPERPERGEAPVAAASSLTDDFGVVCRWHQSCFDLHTGEIKAWCDRLNQDGTSPGMEYLGDISKNRNRLQVFPCRLQDGYIWVSFD
jgi:class 3 adenylate cyclase/nitrite reductase/ring-hydroxylating ferredoxin subunit